MYALWDAKTLPEQGEACRVGRSFLCFENCFWGQWEGSKAMGEHVGRRHVAKSNEHEEKWMD